VLILAGLGVGVQRLSHRRRIVRVARHLPLVRGVRRDHHPVFLSLSSMAALGSMT